MAVSNDEMFTFCVGLESSVSDVGVSGVEKENPPNEVVVGKELTGMSEVTTEGGVEVEVGSPGTVWMDIPGVWVELMMPEVKDERKVLDVDPGKASGLLLAEISTEVGMLVDTDGGEDNGPQFVGVTVTVDTEIERTVTVTTPLWPMTMGEVVVGTAGLTIEEDEVPDGDNGDEGVLGKGVGCV